MGDLLRRPGHTTLSAFSFYSVTSEVRPLLAAELGRTPASELDRALAQHGNPAGAVSAVIRAALLRPDTGFPVEDIVGPLEAGWRAWLSQARHIRLKPWLERAPFNVAAELARESGIHEVIRTAEGLGVLADARRLVGEGARHAEVYAHLAPRRAAAVTRADEDLCTELDLIGLWYHRARHRALTSVYECDYATEDFPWLPATTPDRHGYVASSVGKT